MKKSLTNITYNQFEKIFNVLAKCTDSFIFLYDTDFDEAVISENSMNFFRLPAPEFKDARKYMKKLVHPDDIANFMSDLSLFFKKDVSDKVNELHSIEFRALDTHGKYIWMNCRSSVLRKEKTGSAVIVGSVSIVDQDDKIDPVTKLPAEAQLKSDFLHARKKTQKISGFMLKIDVDNLGMVNEQYGMRTGDFVLYLVADCVKRACSGTANPYKLKSDEIICVNFTGLKAEDAQKIYLKLRRELAEIHQKIDDVQLTVSAGAVAFFNDSSQFDDLLKKVNFSVVYAKRRGRNNLAFFNAFEYTKHLRELELQERLRESIRRNFEGFELFYQPVVNARQLYVDEEQFVTNVIGAEGLLRWSSPKFGMLLPDEFIPILERTGLIIPVGRWILITSFNQCKEWNKVQKDFHMNINLSYVQLKKSDSVSDVQMAIEKSGVNPANITLELTESGYMDNAQELQQLIEEFVSIGVMVDIDDFGTGYSNLRYLQYLHASTLKLDYTFVHKATGGDECDSKVVRHVTELAHELNMSVCMEGVETADDIKVLEQYKPDKYQGFYFGRPCPAVAFSEHHLRPDELWRKNENKPADNL